MKRYYIRGKEYKKLKNDIAEVIIASGGCNRCTGLRLYNMFYDVVTLVNTLAVYRQQERNHDGG